MRREHETKEGDYSGRNLRGADLSGRDLRGSDFRGCDLKDAYLRNSDLRGALFRGGNLPLLLTWMVATIALNGYFAFSAREIHRWYLHPGTWIAISFAGGLLALIRDPRHSFKDANLDGADLGGALYDKRTKWPSGFDPGAVGVVESQPVAK